MYNNNLALNPYLTEELETEQLFIAIFERKIERVPKGFWNEYTATLAVKTLLEKYLCMGRKEICKNFSAKLMNDYGIRSARKFSSMYELVSRAFPNFDIKIWELNKVKDNGWTKNNIISSIKWLVEEVYTISPEQAILLERKHFDLNNLSYVYKLFGRCTQKVIKFAYPDLQI